MVRLTIDHIPIEAKEGISVMDAAAILGIAIPAMCYREGTPHHPSCMVCLVKDGDRDIFIPSCAMPVAEGMNILTDTEEVRNARRAALELLLSDHVGDCEAPCRLSCPAFMDIPLVNRLISYGKFDQALRVATKEIALPLILGHICPAPCEKACRRRPIGQAVSICLLKRSAAQFGHPADQILQGLPVKNGKKVAIIGTGPAGLSAAFYLSGSGHECVLFDKNEKAGGEMRYSIPADRLPEEMLDEEIGIIRHMGTEFRLGVTVTGEMFRDTILPGFDAVILATGNVSSNPVDIFGISPAGEPANLVRKDFTTSIPGVFGCGNMIREQKMAVHSVAQGKMAAMQAAVYLGTSIDPASPGGEKEKMPGRKHKSVSAIGPLSEQEWQEYLKESVPGKRLVPAAGLLSGFTREEAMDEARRCMHCDCRKPVSCKLRLYADEYDADRRRFAGPARKLLTKSYQHDLVVYETGKCIRCGLCVEIAEQHGEAIGLTYAGRGFDVRITVPFGETIREALAKSAEECVNACPTGALAFKLHEEREPS